MHVSIIGAGPIGSHTAQLLARQGHDVHLYEDHAVVGKPIQCTGLMTMSLNDVLRPDSEYIINTTDRIEIVAPNGRKTEIKAKEYIVCRTKFDQYLANKAQDAGATVHTNHRFMGKNSNGILLKNTNGVVEIKTDVLVGADGANSAVAKLLNPDRKRNYCVGIQARVSGMFDPRKYTVYFDNSISPGFFAWIVPESEGIARVGLKGTSGNFLAFIKKFGYKQLEMQSGPIPVYDSRYCTEKDNTYLVGDAAMQVKATTAGGIIPGLKAAACLADALEHGDSYEKRWKAKIGKDLWLHLKVRRMLDKFTNDDWNRFIELVGQERVRKVFEQHDREKPWKLMKAVVKEPRLLWFGRYVV